MISPIEAVVIFLIVFGAHMNVLLVIKVTVLVLTKWSYRFPFMLNIKQYGLESHVPIVFKSI